MRVSLEWGATLLRPRWWDSRRGRAPPPAPGCRPPSARARIAPMTLVELPLAETHAPGCGPVRRSNRLWKRALVLLLVHGAIAVHVAHWKLTGRTLTPLEPSEAGETLTTGAVNAGFVFFALLVLSTLVLGRFF